MKKLLLVTMTLLLTTTIAYAGSLEDRTDRLSQGANYVFSPGYLNIANQKTLEVKSQTAVTNSPPPQIAIDRAQIRLSQDLKEDSREVVRPELQEKKGSQNKSSSTRTAQKLNANDAIKGIVDTGDGNYMVTLQNGETKNFTFAEYQAFYQTQYEAKLNELKALIAEKYDTLFWEGHDIQIYVFYYGQQAGWAGTGEYEGDALNGIFDYVLLHGVVNGQDVYTWYSYSSSIYNNRDSLNYYLSNSGSVPGTNPYAIYDSNNNIFTMPSEVEAQSWEIATTDYGYDVGLWYDAAYGGAGIYSRIEQYSCWVSNYMLGDAYNAVATEEQNVNYTAADFAKEYVDTYYYSEMSDWSAEYAEAYNERVDLESKADLYDYTYDEDEYRMSEDGVFADITNLTPEALENYLDKDGPGAITANDGKPNNEAYNLTLENPGEMDTAAITDLLLNYNARGISRGSSPLAGILADPNEDQQFVIDVSRLLLADLQNLENVGVVSDADPDLSKAQSELVQAMAKVLLAQAMPDLLKEGDLLAIRQAFSELNSLKSKIISSYEGSINNYYSHIIRDMVKNMDALMVNNTISKLITREEFDRLPRSEIDRILKEIKKKSDKTFEEEYILQQEAKYRAQYLDVMKEKLSADMKTMLTSITRKLSVIINDTKEGKR